MGGGQLTGTVTVVDRDPSTGQPFVLINHKEATYRCDERTRGAQLFTLGVGRQVYFEPAELPPGRGGGGYVARVSTVPAPSQVSCKPEHLGAAMFNWAFFPEYKSILETLKGLALPESWSCGGIDVLNNYLRYTFDRLQLEDKLCKNEKCAAFNTGLVDKNYEYIYMFFEKNAYNVPAWYFTGFAVGEERGSKKMLHNFYPLPAKAKYYTEVADCFYDLRLGPPMCDYEHILEERVERLPGAFLSEHCPQGFQLLPGVLLAAMDLDMKKEYYDKLREAYQNDEKLSRRMKSRFKDAVALAMKKIEWNDRTVVPIYFPRKGKISLLLPLALADDSIVDTALVTEKTDAGAYVGNTILDLKTAYNSARLIARPDSGWLKPDESFALT